MAAEFKAKDEVLVGSLKRLGIVLGSPRPGWYQVLVGGLKVEVRASELKPRGEVDKNLLKTLKKIAQPKAGDAKNPPTQPARLDLHGMRVEEAMKLVEKAMDRAIIEGHSRMEIVHGIGAGKIREALHKYLASLPIIESFKVDDGNAGVTWVYF